MISTDNDIKDLVYMLLQNSQLKAEVTGQILKVSRNPASTNEDVVISVLANDNPRQIQSAYVNVNIYVMDIYFQQGGEKYKVENTARTKELSRIFADMFEKAIIGEAYRLTLDRQRVIAVEGANEHCVNNRLLYQCVNE